MKKTLCVLITILLLFTSAPSVVFAANDAADLGYQLKIEVEDENGRAANTFQIGDTIRVRVSLVYTGTGRAPVYGLQGKLYFDPYVINSLSIVEKNRISALENNGKITFAYLDMTGQGQNDSMLGNLGEVVFKARSNGTVQLYGDDFIVTNRDASARYVDISQTAMMIIGTGIKDVTKELLENDIAAAERMLADCIITDQTNPQIYYPDYWITTQTEQAFRAKITLAKNIFNKADATAQEIETAVAELAAAVKAFEKAKIIGPERWSDSSSSSESIFVVVNASVIGENGRVHPDFITQKCRRTTSCTIRFLPNEGYETEYVYVNGERFAGSELFTIPKVDRDTTVKAVFCKIPPFTDVIRTDWYYVSVRYAYNHALFKGTSENEFSPKLNMTRAMLATVLYRMDGEPEVNASAAFEDVKTGMWYTDAIGWAHENNIVKGYGKGIFAPDDFITREQMAVMLYRYAAGKGQITDESQFTLSFTDASEISDFAVEAMKWAVAQGLIKGNTETTVNPLGKASRAEVATILMRYLENESN